jgi:stringent starvation protein B
MALWGAGQVQWATDPEEAPYMIDSVHPAGLGVHATAGVRDDRIVLPAIPEFAGDLDELGGTLVTLGV